MTDLVQFAHRLLNAFAQPNGVALRTEHHAVERVGNNHEGQLLRLRQAAAEKIGTISYELLCGVSRRVPRIYRENGKVVNVADYLK